jgi:hypothetical protein
MYTDQINDDEIGGKASSMREKKNIYTVLVGNFEGKRPLGKPRRRWDTNIKMDRNHRHVFVNTVIYHWVS